jgi:hypothetical protein
VPVADKTGSIRKKQGLLAPACQASTKAPAKAQALTPRFFAVAMSKAKEPAGWPKRLAHLQRSGRLPWFKTATEWSSAYGLIQNLNEKGFDRETRESSG